MELDPTPDLGIDEHVTVGEMSTHPGYKSRYGECAPNPEAAAQVEALGPCCAIAITGSSTVPRIGQSSGSAA